MRLTQMDGKTNLKTKTNLIDQNENFQTLETKIKITPNLRDRNIIQSKIFFKKICDFFVKFEESTKRSTILAQGMYAKVFFFWENHMQKNNGDKSKCSLQE